MSRLLKGERHLPAIKQGGFYAYCGPQTRLDIRLKSEDPTLRNPINSLDRACKSHDLAYQNVGLKMGKGLPKNEAQKLVRVADKQLINSIDKLDDAGKLDKMLVKGSMSAKIKAEDIGFLNKLKFIQPITDEDFVEDEGDTPVEKVQKRRVGGRVAINKYGCCVPKV